MDDRRVADLLQIVVGRSCYAEKTQTVQTELIFWYAFLEFRQARSLRHVVLLTAGPEETLGGVWPDQAAQLSASVRHLYHR